MSFRFLDLTLPSAEENVALDEALLEQAESQGGSQTLRIWEPAEPIVVIGRSSRIADEVDLEYCSHQNIPVLRRASGGASIVTAPGCLMYAVLIDYNTQPELRSLDLAHQFVMSKMRAALLAVGIEAQMNGTCDLTLDNRKFSGNAMRSKRSWMLYHGTMICGMDLSLISSCLRMPDRQPDYREGRSHTDFLTRVPLATHELKNAIINEFGAVERQSAWPIELTYELIKQKYSQHGWNHKR